MRIVRPSGGFNIATFYIAASNSSDKDKRNADLICDGVDDQVQILNALATIRLAGIGGDVLLANGEYLCDDPDSDGVSIKFDQSSTRLAGKNSPVWGGYVRAWNGTLGTGLEGDGCAKLKAVATGFNLIEIQTNNVPDGGENRHRGIIFENLYLYGAGDSYGIYNATAGAYHDMCRFRNLMIHNFDKGMEMGVDAGIFADLIIQDCAGDGLTVHGTNSKVGPNNLIYDNGGVGITITGTQINCHNNQVGDNGDTLGDTGILLTGPGCKWCSVTNNTLSNNGGIKTTAGEGHTIIGNRLRATSGVKIGVTTRTTDVTVNSNYLYNDVPGSAYAVEFVGSSYGTCVGNTITGGGWNFGSTSTLKWNGACKVGYNSGDNSVETLPTLSTGTVLGWYRADVFERKFYADGTTLTAWPDSSGNARDMTAGGTPKYYTDVKNGKGVVRFNGSTDYMNKTSWPTTNQPFTFICVAKQASTAGTQTPMSGNGGNASMYLSSGTVNLYAGSAVTGAAFTGTNWNIITGVFNGASSKTSVNNGAYSTINAGTAVGSTNMTLGANAGLSNEFFNGDMAEAIVIQGSITDADRTMLHQVLGKKYAVTIS